MSGQTAPGYKVLDKDPYHVPEHLQGKHPGRISWTLIKIPVGFKIEDVEKIVRPLDPKSDNILVLKKEDAKDYNKDAQGPSIVVRMGYPVRKLFDLLKEHDFFMGSKKSSVFGILRNISSALKDEVDDRLKIEPEIKRALPLQHQISSVRTGEKGVIQEVAYFKTDGYYVEVSREVKGLTTGKPSGYRVRVDEKKSFSRAGEGRVMSKKFVMDLLEAAKKREAAEFLKDNNFIKDRTANKVGGSGFSNMLDKCIERIKSEFIDKSGLVKIVMDIATDINDHPGLDKQIKQFLIGLSMDYKNKGNLSKDDVLTFIDYVKKFA